MKIYLTYKLKNKNSIEEIVINPKEYFEDLENDNYDEAIAKHDNEWQYILELNPLLCIQDFEYSSAELRGSKNSDFIIKTNHFDNETKIKYRKENSGYEIIIQCIQIAKNCISITRMERDNFHSEWKNININLALNYNGGENEKWYNSKKGDYINQIIIDKGIKTTADK